MPDAGQTGLDDYTIEDTPRPLREAQAVAGNPSTHAEVELDTASETNARIELALQTIDYTIETDADGAEYPVIHIFGRREDEASEHVRVLGFRPYFFVPEEHVDELADDDRVTEIERGYQGIDERAVAKVYAQTPRDVGNLREGFRHYEADVRFPNRLLIDRGIRSGIAVPERRREDGTLEVIPEEIEAVDVDASPRVFVFDIEVDDRRGFPEDGEEPIISIASYDSGNDRYGLWLYIPPEGTDDIPEAVTGYEPIEGDIDVELFSFDSEAAMLDAFLTHLAECDVDVMTGWNFEDFDAPYLLDRLNRLEEQNTSAAFDLDSDRLSRVGEVWDSNWGAPNVKGHVVFDLLYAYRRTVFSELESYRLDAVGEAELGVGKERYPGKIGDLWENDPERLLEYNLRDVELCVELDRQQEIISFWREVATFVGCQLADAPTPGDAVDMYVLHEAHDRFVLPSKGQHDGGEEYEGGAVFDPITGVKENVTVLDLKSLYPMCMTTINASPETKVNPDEYEGPAYTAPTGTHFRKEPDGINREMITELLAEREEKKQLRNQHEPGTPEYEQYDRQQGAVKVIMNCFTPDTEVLTPAGVREITDLTVGDAVYSLNPETLQLEVKPVIETHAYPDYDGELIDIKTDEIDFRITPNHRMFLQSTESGEESENGYQFIEAGDLDVATRYRLPHDWDGPAGETLEEVDLTAFIDGNYEVVVRPSVPDQTFTAELGWRPQTIQHDDTGDVGYVFTSSEFDTHREVIETLCEQSWLRRESGQRWIPRTYTGDTFLALLARLISKVDSSVAPTTDLGESATALASSVDLPQKHRPITDGGAGECVQPSAVLEKGDEPGDWSLPWAVFEPILMAPTESGDHALKIPEFVFACSQRQKRQFYNDLIDSGGIRRGSSWQFTTLSEGLRDDLLRLCAHLGQPASYVREGNQWRIGSNEASKNSFDTHHQSTKGRADTGVYCVTVADNHTLLAGRNGKFQFVGQSLYGVSGWERFRLYDKEAAAAITATGRRVIEFTKEAANELEYEVTYGDTDSVMLALGTDVSIEEAIEQSFDIESYINSRYDDFAKRELNAETHRFQIEFEKLYRRFFQAGKKKRYAGHIVWKEGNEVDDIDITGFEYQRSDIAPITKDVQHRVLEMIVKEGDIEGVKSYLHEVIDQFERGDLDPETVAIPGGIGKRLTNYETDTAHVRGAKYANLLLGTNFKRGDKPKRLYLKNVHPEYFARLERERGLDPQADPLYGAFKADPDVICFEYSDQLPAEFEIDWEKMLEKTLKGPIARIMEALDVSWLEIKSGQTQTGLGQYGN